MAILASGVRYDPINGIQATIVVTDDNNGKASDINPHIQQAANLGHIWINIPPTTYSAFSSPQDIAAFVTQAAAASSKINT